MEPNTQWIRDNGTTLIESISHLIDESGNRLVDESGSYLQDSQSSDGPDPVTDWTETQ